MSNDEENTVIRIGLAVPEADGAPVTVRAAVGLVFLIAGLEVLRVLARVSRSKKVDSFYWAKFWPVYEKSAQLNANVEARKQAGDS